MSAAFGKKLCPGPMGSPARVRKSFGKSADGPNGERVERLSPGVAVVERAIKALMAHAYAKWRKRNKAMKLLDELTKPSNRRAQSSLATDVSPHSIAEIYSALGQIDEAFEWLNQAYEQHDMQMVSLLTN